MTLSRIIARGLEALALACAGLAALGMVAIVAVISTGVVMRRMGTPLHMTEELVGLLLSVTLLLGLPMVTLKATHVRVAIIADNARGTARTGLRIVALVFSIAFFAWLMVEALPWFEFAYGRNLKTQTARLLLYPWMAILPLTLALCGIIFVARLLGLVPQDGDRQIERADVGGSGG